MNFDRSNTIFQKAIAFVNHTSKHLFLTGKAGTGKTTFLKYIKENSSKKIAIVAPTGVAAINAEGITIHSFFQLPIGSFSPSTFAFSDSSNISINNKDSLIKNLRLRSSRRKLLRELDLLIIDEVSMVRADLVDAIDTVLRYVRKQPSLPFGGVQMLYIGDLFQLPPVVQKDEWVILKNYYTSPFFFDAQVIQNEQPIYIELKKIYRQKDDRFISILNKIRDNDITQKDIDFLNSFYNPDFLPSEEDNCITLTTHNEKADRINELELGMLTGIVYSYEADVAGEFDERMFPNDKVLLLKEGAQIMFIKNDRGEARRYFNGKIGKIAEINDQKIMVSFPNQTDWLELELERWQNIQYDYNSESDIVEEMEIGSFTQFPIRLAWAITIHKSQGLTFDKAVIDAGESFAPGQVYVALSRLTALEGLVLHSKINLLSIKTNERVVEYINNASSENELQSKLVQEQWLFIKRFLKQSFEVNILLDEVNETFKRYVNKQTANSNPRIEWVYNIKRDLGDLNQVSLSFQKHLDWLLRDSQKAKYDKLFNRTVAASAYFIKMINDKLVSRLKIQLKVRTTGQKVSGRVKQIFDLILLIERKKTQLRQATDLAEALYKSASLVELLKMVEEYQKPIEVKFPEGLETMNDDL